MFFSSSFISIDSEFEELETTPRYRPDSLSALSRSTRFSEAEIKRIYRGFKAECPTGVVKEETFKIIYSHFFPQGGLYAYSHLVFQCCFFTFLLINIKIHENHLVFFVFVCENCSLDECRFSSGTNVRNIWLSIRWNKLLLLRLNFRGFQIKTSSKQSILMKTDRQRTKMHANTMFRQRNAIKEHREMGFICITKYQKNFWLILNAGYFQNKNIFTIDYKLQKNK